MRRGIGGGYDASMLSIVSTPIGNLGDITERAKQTLAACDAIICEDTRVTGKLLTLLDIPSSNAAPLDEACPEYNRRARGKQREKKEFISFHSFNEHQKLESLVSRLLAGEHLALVSDAGTPGISDPGYLLISRAQDAGVNVEVVPGPSAFLAALSVSGLPIHHFVYLGFLPEKKGRRTLLESLREEKRTVVFYESPHRIIRTLTELADVLSDQRERSIVLCRELTKMHEEVIRTTIGKLSEVLASLTVKGEFVVIIGPFQ